MKLIISLALLTIAGCGGFQPRVLTPEERAQQMYMAQLGLQLMAMGQPHGPPPPTTYIINGRTIVCSQMNNVVVCN